MIASPSRLSRRVWTRLHARDHSCFVIWVPESHICMQSTTPLSCSRKGERVGGVRVGICANVAPVPKLRVTIAMRSKRMGRSWRAEKTAAELRGGSGPPKVRVTSTRYRSHVALKHQLTGVMGCQGSESTHVVAAARPWGTGLGTDRQVGTFRVWLAASVCASMAATVRLDFPPGWFLGRRVPIHPFSGSASASLA